MTKKKEKVVKLPNDFERMIPEYHKGSIIYGEHVVRYMAAAKLLKNKVVLDIASGSGYGTKILAKDAEKVIGVDISTDSIKYAQQNFSAGNIKYIAGDGRDIPLKDNEVDVVVSFETIEHIEDYKHFLKEVKRVLKPDGLLILSTPNDEEFAEGNHFHLHEFTFSELKSLTKGYFSNNKAFFQGTWLYTALLEEESISQEKIVNLATLNAAPLKPENYLYFFLLCSNRFIDERLDNLAAISEHWSERNNQEKVRLTDQHVKNISDMLGAAEKYSKELTELLASKDKYIASIEAELQRIKNSATYKVAQKAKKAGELFKRA